MEKTAQRHRLALPTRETLAHERTATPRCGGQPESYARLVAHPRDREFGRFAPSCARPEPVGAHRVPAVRPAPRSITERAAMADREDTAQLPQALDPAMKTGTTSTTSSRSGKRTEPARDDAILLDLRGRVTEGPTSNVFFVQARVLVPPPTRSWDAGRRTAPVHRDRPRGRTDPDGKSRTVRRPWRRADDVFMDQHRSRGHAGDSPSHPCESSARDQVRR